MKRNTNFKNNSKIDRIYQVNNFHVDSNLSPLRESIDDESIENTYFRSSNGKIFISPEREFIEKNKKRLRKEKRNNKAKGNRQKRRRQNINFEE